MQHNKAWFYRLEFNWRTGEGRDLFTGVMYRHYNAPPGFNFDRRGVDPPMVRNPASPEYNIPERLEEFLVYLKQQVSVITCVGLVIQNVKINSGAYYISARFMCTSYATSRAQIQANYVEQIIEDNFAKPFRGLRNNSN